jgi:D-alanine-D-alanine ligase
MKKVLILAGGESAEHEVSIRSAKNVIAALDDKKFQPIIIGISKAGYWYHVPASLFQEVNTIDDDIYDAANLKRTKEGVVFYTSSISERIDIAFPVLHGPNGEDGTIQGYFRMLKLPFVGCDVLSSSVGMNKIMTKKVLSDAHIHVVPYEVMDTAHPKSFDFISRKLGVPFFLKAALMGSSVGVHKVKNEEDFKAAVADAIQYGNEILLEQAIAAREIECAVIGNYYPTASTLGEVRPTGKHDFYSYEAKYMDPDGAELILPAQLPDDVIAKIKKMALDTFYALNCQGMARVDFFYDAGSHQIYVNEINTIPGFTQISMYPKLLQYDGYSYTDIITKLIDLGFEHYQNAMEKMSSLKAA